jgi:hypothetical protein
MKEHGGHEDLHGSGRQSVIPYVHRRMGVVLLCVLFNFKVELALNRIREHV